MPILGMHVVLSTHSSDDAETDDEIYLGLWGSAGGREFPLSSKEIDDFERGTTINYALGEDPGFGVPTIRPDRSAPGEDNDPALVPLALNSIQYVYLRKQAYGTGLDDNAWRLQTVIVFLFEQATPPVTSLRTFLLNVPEGLWFGNEHGHQVWIPEARGDTGAALRRLGVKAEMLRKLGM
jgi:hypothetical protein